MLGSRWIVEDNATALLVGRFLEEMLTETQPLLATVRALARARRWLRDEGGYKHPVFSGAFSAFEKIW